LKPFNFWQKQICPSSPKGNNSMNPSIQRKFPSTTISLHVYLAHINTSPLLGIQPKRSFKQNFNFQFSLVYGCVVHET
jgi:hypothetical protein